jgi:hypothetical protein
MKFTIKPKPFITMVNMAGERRPKHKRGGTWVRLLACEDRVCLESGAQAMEAEALIWEEGQCRLSRTRLLQALKRHQGVDKLTIEVDERQLHLDRATIPVSQFSAQATLPPNCQMVLATDLDVVPSQTLRAGAA